MRRLPVIAVLVALLLLAAPLAAVAADTAPSEPVVLAAAAGEPLGPDPMERMADENVARELAGYEDRELPYHWGAAWILSFAGLVGLVLFAGLYYLLVHRPAQQRQG